LKNGESQGPGRPDPLMFRTIEELAAQNTDLLSRLATIDIETVATSIRSERDELKN
jgi:hypothetical protein